MLDSYEQCMADGEAPTSLDKEYVRTFLATEHNYRGDGPVPPIPDDVRVEAVVRYAKAFEMITGEESKEASSRLCRTALRQCCCG